MKNAAPRCKLDPIGINLFTDRLIEAFSRRRAGLAATMEALLPKAASKFCACAVAVETVNEDLRREVFWWGKEPAFELEKAPARLDTRRSAGLFWVTRPLDLAGRRVGTFAFAYRSAFAPDAAYRACLDALCEELDNILWNIQSAAVKQRLAERVTRSLTRTVLSDALDDAVKALREEIPFLKLGVVYRNDDDSGGLQYRVYRGPKCVADSEMKPHKALARALKLHGVDALEPDRTVVRRSLGIRDGVAFVLSGRAAGASRLGRLVVEAEGGLSVFGRDLMRIFANSIAQRLIDYNRERRHMAKFFSPDTVSELLRDPKYVKAHLAPRVRDVAILYVDINSFTKLCEKGLRKPDKIGEFVDAWSAEAVRLVWEHGGVFDKMVGDCVIGLFGPPFYRKTPLRCALDAVTVARKIQAYTIRLGRQPKYRGLAPKIGARGLGVGVGVNLCTTAVGLFGPNHDFTAFSSGMNETARLQSKAGFREILVMAPLKEKLEKAKLSKWLRFEGPFEAEAKNVARPLRYYKLKGA